MIYGADSGGGFIYTDFRPKIQERRVEPIVASGSDYSQGERGRDYSGNEDASGERTYSPFRRYFEGLGKLVDRAA